MDIVEPEGWRELWERAQTERDPKKLLELIDEINRLLTEWEKKDGPKAASPVSDSRRASPQG